MLNDFVEFIADGEDSQKVSEGYYCLQSVVVKPREWEDANGNQIDGYEVIDGQQRLTTPIFSLPPSSTRTAETKTAQRISTYSQSAIRQEVIRMNISKV